MTDKPTDPTTESTTNRQKNLTRTDRRSVLQTVSVAGVGLTLPSSMDAAVTAAAESTGRSHGQLYSYLFLEPVVVRLDELSPAKRDFVQTLLSKGTITTTGHRPLAAGVGAPIAGEEFVKSDGELHRLNLNEAGERRTTRFAVQAERRGGATIDTVPLTAYTGQARKAVKGAIRLARGSERRELPPEQRGVVFEDASPDDIPFAPDRTGDNDLLPVPAHEYVVDDGETFHLSTQAKEVSLPTYEYSLTPASSADIFDGADNPVRLTEDALSSEQAAIVETAIDEEFYRETSPYSQAYEQVLASFDASAEANHFDGRYEVTVDGDRYVGVLWSVSSC